MRGTVLAQDCTRERLREGALSKFISGQVPRSTPGSKQQYHALSRGWILNEIVRRADPKGRTIGEFLRDDIAAPLPLHEEPHFIPNFFDKNDTIESAATRGETTNFL